MNKIDQMTQFTKADYEKAKKSISEYIGTLSNENKKVTKEDFDIEVSRVFSMVHKTNDPRDIKVLKAKIEALKDLKTLIDHDHNNFSDEGHSC